jgi:hypothetical protein
MNSPQAADDELLYRFGRSPESAARLERKAAAAEAVIGIFGVSASANLPDIPSSSAWRSAIASHFFIHDTPTAFDSLHRTVELTKPVTSETAKLFNTVFGR